MSPVVTLCAEPAVALVDGPLSVRVEGLRPRSLVTLRARVEVPAQAVWAAEVLYVAAADGTVDVATDTPVFGDYLVPDAQGLLWSLSPQPESVVIPKNARFFDTAVQDFEVLFSVEVDGEVVARDSVIRQAVAADVSSTEVRENGLHGTLFLPPGDGPHPVILVVPGSDGGVPEPFAALYASHGYAALALGYFNVPDAPQLPQFLVDVELEYFERAFTWLVEHPQIDERRIAVSGASRGGELALLLGSRFDQVAAVVGWVPSGYVNGGFPGPEDDREDPPAWLWQGEPLPYLGFASAKRQDSPELFEGHRAPAIASLRRLQDREAHRYAEIEVEKIGGPVILIAGDHDTLWPSGIYSRWIAERLREHNFAHPFEVLTYPNAGHTVGPAGNPATVRNLGEHQVAEDGTVILAAHQGGIPQGIAQARQDLWPRLLTFLSTHLAPAEKRNLG